MWFQVGTLDVQLVRVDLHGLHEGRVEAADQDGEEEPRAAASPSSQSVRNHVFSTSRPAATSATTVRITNAGSCAFMSVYGAAWTESLGRRRVGEIGDVELVAAAMTTSSSAPMTDRCARTGAQVELPAQRPRRVRAHGHQADDDEHGEAQPRRKRRTGRSKT